MRILCLFFLIPFFLFSQNIKEIDSLSLVLCTKLEESSPGNLSAKQKINFSYEKIVLPYILKEKNDSIQKEISKLVFYRTQRGCKVFLDLMNDANKDSNPMKRITEEPKSKLKPIDAQTFKNYKNFTYKEHTGSLAKVEITNKSWVTYHSDGSVSKYNLKWFDDIRFEVEFIESNHPAIKKMNLIGDKYQYKLLGSIKNGFKLCEWVEGMNKYSIFEMNYKTGKL